MAKTTNRLSRIKGKQIDRFIQAVKIVRPKITVPYTQWHELSPEKRSARIISFFEINGFTEAEKKNLEKRVFAIKIPWKLLGILSLLLVLATVGYLYFQFLNQKRVYAIGNDIPVFLSASNSTVAKRLNIFGLSNSDISTSSSMILVKDTTSGYTVSDDNFSDWLFGNKKYYLLKDGVVSEKEEYEDYYRIFKAAKGIKAFDKLSLYDRKVIKSCIDSNNVMFKAVVEVAGDTTSIYMPFLSVGGLENQHHIFICLRRQNGQLFNIKINSTEGLYANYKEVQDNFGKTFDSALVWKETKGDQFSIISFLDVTSKQIYQSFSPPYEPFTKQ